MGIKELWFCNLDIAELVNDPTRKSWYSEASLEPDNDHSHKLFVVNPEEIKALEEKLKVAEKEIELQKFINSKMADGVKDFEAECREKLKVALKAFGEVRYHNGDASKVDEILDKVSGDLSALEKIKAK
jgi:hypothetical protein